MEQSKYTIIETENGFRVECPERSLVTVELAPEKTHFIINGGVEHLKGLYHFREILKAISVNVWFYNPHMDKSRPLFPGYYDWRRKKTAWALNPRVHAQWERLLEKVPDLIRQAQKAIFAAYPTQDPDIVFWTGFYEDEFWLQDIINYRAAALVPHIMDYWQGDFSFDWSNWMGLYSYNNQAYTSLRRTLMNLPGNIPPHILSKMSLLELERPITDRVELVSLLSAVTPFDSRHANVFMYATREQLLRAFRKVADHLRQDKPLSTRKITNIVSPVIYIADYPDVHQGNVVGLAEKSIRWHRHLQEHRTARTIDELGGDRPTALPPAVLPDDARLRFLSSVADVVEEGQRMGHCVSSYARYAVQGHCYLFHVEYSGEEATVEVDPQGSVRQAYGPNNSSNKASEWGKRVLNKWGSNFLQQPTYALGD